MKRGIGRKGNDMPQNEPLKKTREDYKEIISAISLANSPVGIDAQYTHAVIITYLQQLSQRLERIEQALNTKV